MPKYEDLEFLKKKILEIGNEEEVLKNKNIIQNVTPIPEEVSSKEVDIDQGELLKDITEDFKEGLHFDEEEFSDIKEPEVEEDFLESLSKKDISKEDEILGNVEPLDINKTSKQESGENDLDSLLAGLSENKAEPEPVDETSALLDGLMAETAPVKEQTGADFNDLMADLETFNPKEEAKQPEKESAYGSQFEDLSPLEEKISKEELPEETVPLENVMAPEDILSEEAETGSQSEEENFIPKDELGDDFFNSLMEEPLGNEDSAISKEASGELDSLLSGLGMGGQAEKKEFTEEKMPVGEIPDDLSSLAGDFASAGESGEEGLEGLLSQENIPEEELSAEKKGSFDDGLVDLAGDFAGRELTKEEKPPVIDETLADLFETTESEELPPVEEVAENPVEEKQPEQAEEDLFGDLSISEIDLNETFPKESKASTDELLNFSDESLDGHDEIPEEFGEEKLDFSGIDSYVPEDIREEKNVAEKKEAKQAKEPEKDYGEVVLTPDERKQIVITLASLPKDAEIKISKAIISGKYSDKQLKPLIDVLIDNEKAQTIIRIYERITGDKSLSRLGAEKLTGQEFVEKQRSFGYMFKKNILPILTRIAAAVLVLCFILVMWVTVFAPTFEASKYYNLGKKNLKEKRFYEVEPNFEKGWAIQERYSEVIDYARLYRDYKRFIEAEAKYFKAMKMRPGLDLKLEVADFFGIAGDYERSIKYYSDVLKVDRKNFKAALGKAKTYVRWAEVEKDKIADAKEAYLDVLDIDSMNADAAFGLLDIYIEEKDYKEIMRHYNYTEKVLKKANPVTYSNLAEYLIERGEVDEIKNILQKAAKSAKNKNYPEIDYMWAKYKKYLDVGNEEKMHLENAERRFEAMRVQEPERYEEPKYKKLLADVYNDLGENYDRYAKINLKAEEYYNKAIEVKPDYGKAYYNLGTFALRHKVDYVSAMTNYLEAENRGYENDNMDFNLGWLYYRNSQFEDSYKRISNLMEKFPDNSNLKFMVGTIFYQLGNYDLAEGFLLEVYNKCNDLKQMRGTLDMGKQSDKTIAEMLVRTSNNLGATLQKKYETTGNSKYLVWATKYYSTSIENLSHLNETSEAINIDKRMTPAQSVDFKRFDISNANQNLRMVLYPQAGLSDPILFEDFPLDFESKL